MSSVSVTTENKSHIQSLTNDLYNDIRAKRSVCSSIGRYISISLTLICKMSHIQIKYRVSIAHNNVQSKIDINRNCLIPVDCEKHQTKPLHTWTERAKKNYHFWIVMDYDSSVLSFRVRKLVNSREASFGDTFARTHKKFWQHFARIMQNRLATKSCVCVFELNVSSVSTK